MDDTTPKPSLWRGLMQEWGPRAVFESILIVLSIVLALSLSAWAQDQQTKSRVREARAFFIQEIRANRDILTGDDLIPHHRRIHDVIEKLDFNHPISQADATPAKEAVFATGVHVAQLRDVVWRTYSGNALMEHFPPEEAFAINDAYRAQEQLSLLQSSYYPVLAQMPAQMMLANDLRAPLIGLELHLGDVIGSEENAVSRYDAALAVLEKTK